MASRSPIRDAEMISRRNRETVSFFVGCRVRPNCYLSWTDSRVGPRIGLCTVRCDRYTHFPFRFSYTRSYQQENHACAAGKPFMLATYLPHVIMTLPWSSAPCVLGSSIKALYCFTVMRFAKLSFVSTSGLMPPLV